MVAVLLPRLPLQLLLLPFLQTMPVVLHTGHHWELLCQCFLSLAEEETVPQTHPCPVAVVQFRPRRPHIQGVPLRRLRQHKRAACLGLVPLRQQQQQWIHSGLRRVLQTRVHVNHTLITTRLVVGPSAAGALM